MDFLPNSFPGNLWAVTLCSMFPLKFKVQNLATINYYFFLVYSVEGKTCAGCSMEADHDS